jgi:hypothetical protein
MRQGRRVTIPLFLHTSHTTACVVPVKSYRYLPLHSSVAGPDMSLTYYKVAVYLFVNLDEILYFCRSGCTVANQIFPLYTVPGYKMLNLVLNGLIKGFGSGLTSIRIHIPYGSSVLA